VDILGWISDNWIEIFGAVTGILYVFLEVRQNLWLWPVGIVTSAVYICVFFTGKLYADMSLQGYYLAISVMGWYWWLHKKRRGGGDRNEVEIPRKRKSERGRSKRSGDSVPEEDRDGKGVQIPSPEIGTKWRFRDSGSLPRESGGSGVGFLEVEKLNVSHLKARTGIILVLIFVVLYFGMWLVLDRLTDSPVPAWDSFITSLSVIATWMLARKIYEHWFLWIVVNISAAILFFTRELYPTVILYMVYCAMSFFGLIEWKKTLKKQ
jgi:nicotinamide mononucleotide transporter